MNKPTAQELWGRIEGRINTLHSISLNAGTLFPGVTTLQIIQDYAQTYHEEQMRDFVGIPQGEFTVGFMNPKSPGAIYLKTYPTNPKNNEL